MNDKFMEVVWDMKLKELMAHMVEKCIIEVEDASNDDFNHIDNFMSNDVGKMELYQNSEVSTIIPYSNNCIQINVYIN